MPVLDDVQAMYNADTKGMLKALWELPEQCARAWELGMAADVSPMDDLRQVVVTGLGGSAIGGDLLRVYAAQRLDVPVVVNRDYVLPEFVGPHTLVFAVSYSGNTEETLSAYAQAREKGASLVVLTTGGKLGEMARNDGVPVITVPGGIAPRSATGYLFIPTLAVLYRMGLLPDLSHEVAECVSLLQSMREELKPEVPRDSNQAKMLAASFHNRIPVIWGSSGTTEVVAQRWKGQINENAKAPACWNVFPELNHNELVGFEFPGELLRRLYVVILRDPRDHPRVQKRFAITREIMEGAVAGVVEIMARGSGALARMYSLVYIGDYASVYLAMLYGVDPGPVRVIDTLKARLAEE
ncbi:bifunctional phosphoglucose/phosphomannose isomerase [Desulfofundulus sp. TPOSR]|uniref:bifunctional phosphoglucose/phosphomannose isomerase n=1 Tax=Desulfofundulus sp. TPOSR TaxID=2714340 RepID=UPI00140DF189|nr:bifunctional phosphoglucose/phosphomannose isomerase [Desulfofundulus sp. TPOSR]NHM28823.1 bifunctional phosphoglucose/phosphomannose isomerase [Desulfofundulus sp. TPOSR]